MSAAALIGVNTVVFFSSHQLLSLQHFSAAFFFPLFFLLMKSRRQRQLTAQATQQYNASVARLRRIPRRIINRQGRMSRSSQSLQLSLELDPGPARRVRYTP